MQRALDTVDVERRALFVLFEIEGESCDDIAAGLGIPVGTVYSRLHYGTRLMREILAAPMPAAAEAGR